MRKGLGQQEAQPSRQEDAYLATLLVNQQDSYVLLK